MEKVHVCSNCFKEVEVEYRDVIPGSSRSGVIVSACKDCKDKKYEELLEEVIPSALDDLETSISLVANEFNRIIEDDPVTKSWLTEILSGLRDVHSNLEYSINEV